MLQAAVFAKTMMKSMNINNLVHDIDKSSLLLKDWRLVLVYRKIKLFHAENRF